MPITEKVILHALPPSHPCLTVAAALELKGIGFERVDLEMGRHGEQISALYGEEFTTVPGLTVGEERIHGSTAILERLEELEPEPALYPADRAESVREAEIWGDGDLQDLGRRLPWGAMRFRPEAMGTFGGGGELDPAGTDFAMKFIHATWKYHGITSVRLAEDLARLPGIVERIEGYADAGVLGGESPTAADLQIGATIRVLLTVGDLVPLLSGTAAEMVARRYFPDYPGAVPAGAFPAGWVPSRR